MANRNFQDLRWPTKVQTGRTIRETKEYILKHVSEYAIDDPAEFIAETYSGLVGGKSYPEDIMKMYKSMKGKL